MKKMKKAQQAVEKKIEDLLDEKALYLYDEKIREEFGKRARKLIIRDIESELRTSISIYEEILGGDSSLFQFQH